MNRSAPSLTIVIPTLNEEERLPSLLADLAELGDWSDIVVVDGGSRDRTAAIAEASGALVVRSKPGRGAQLRAGAARARADWLLFLHADCRLHADAAEALRTFLGSAEKTEFAHFDFALDRDGLLHRVIEFGQDLRERWLGMPYGDQGLLVSRALYDAVGGFPDWVLMEDVGMIDRLSAQGVRVVLPARLVTSSRRYAAEGGLLAWLRNLTLIVLFRLGVPQAQLSRWYAPHASDAPQTVAVFAKAPVPGRVKTRLAVDLGGEEAARIYRVLGRALVDALRDGPQRLVVYVDPPDSESLEAVRQWLGPKGIECRPQSAGDLGARMTAAVEECLADAAAVCVVGTDIPGIDGTTIGSAFRLLDDHDVAIGPATGRGYYLAAMRQPHHGIFEGIPGAPRRCSQRR